MLGTDIETYRIFTKKNLSKPFRNEIWRLLFSAKKDDAKIVASYELYFLEKPHDVSYAFQYSQNGVLGVAEYTSFCKDEICYNKDAFVLITFLEFVLRKIPSSTLAQGIKNAFDEFPSAYEIDDSAEPVCIIYNSNAEMGDSVAKNLTILAENNMTKPIGHMREASDALNENKYEIAVSQSIQAVEYIANKITEKSTLGDALKELKNTHDLTSSLKKGLEGLYGYASEKARHANDKTPPTETEALYIYSICASTCAFLSQTYKDSL